MENGRHVVDEQNQPSDATGRTRTQPDERRFDTAGRLDGTRPPKRTSPAESPPVGLTEEQLFRGYGLPLSPSSPVAPPLPSAARRSAMSTPDERLESALIKVELEAGVLLSYLETLDEEASWLVMSQLQFARLTNALLEVGQRAGRILERDLAVDMSRRSSRR